MRKPWVIAHRGASGHAPENTMAAFERAVQRQQELDEALGQIARRIKSGGGAIFWVQQFVFGSQSGSRTRHRFRNSGPRFERTPIHLKFPACSTGTTLAACGPGDGSDHERHLL